jgi:alpha-beta hydrolase superfamily lysophospholipase
LTHREGRLTGVGGLWIYWQAWLPEVDPRAAVVIAHGAGEHSGRYRHVAARLVADGYAVYAIDHRGHGRSEGSRALIDRIANTVTDLDALVVLAAARHPGVQIFLLAHSMGATIALSYALRHQMRLAGMILSGALAAVPATPAPLRIAGRLLSVVAPRIPLIGVDPALISRDPDVVAAYRSDPLVHHGKLPARTVAEIAEAVERFPDAVRAITLPTLIAYGTDDGLCPPAGSVMLGERIGAADKTVCPYPGLYHEILNEPEHERVLDQICGWLSAHVAPAPVAPPAG